VRVLVVGGGISGLVAALDLARAGVDVTLAEAGPVLGGKIRTERHDGFTIEHGPDSFLASRPAAITLARELGLGEELMGTRDPRKVYIRHRGELVSMPEGLGLVLPTRLMPFVRTRLFSWPEKLRMARDLLAPRQLGDEDVSVGAYLRRRLGDALVDRLAGPLVGGVYNTPVDDVSLDAIVPQLRIAERDHRSLLLAGLAEGRRSRAVLASRPQTARPLGLFVSLRGGMDRFVVAIASAAGEAGAELRTGASVTALERSGSRVDVRFGVGASESFDSIVLATPAPAAARLLAAELPEASSALGTIPHGTSVLVTLAYREGDIARELVGHGYLVPRTEGGLISACTWTSEKWSHRAPDGHVLVRAFARDEAESTSHPDDVLVAFAREEVERTLRIRAQPVLARVSRWEGTMPRYTVGHLERVDAIERVLARWPALVACGASYRGIGLPDCVSQGQAAAGRMLERLGAVTAEPVRPSPA
jgi:protoporphyrinogen/coproporphyrinogen III oxidase